MKAVVSTSRWAASLAVCTSDRLKSVLNKAFKLAPALAGFGSLSAGVFLSMARLTGLYTVAARAFILSVSTLFLLRIEVSICEVWALASSWICSADGGVVDGEACSELVGLGLDSSGRPDPQPVKTAAPTTAAANAATLSLEKSGLRNRCIFQDFTSNVRLLQIYS